MLRRLRADGFRLEYTPDSVGARLQTHRDASRGHFFLRQQHGVLRMIIAAALQRLSRKAVVIAATGVNGVVQERITVIVQRHAPYHAIERARGVGFASGSRAFVKPDEVVDLQQAAPPEPGQSRQEVHNRPTGIHTGA